MSVFAFGRERQSKGNGIQINREKENRFPSGFSFPDKKSSSLIEFEYVCLCVCC